MVKRSDRIRLIYNKKLLWIIIVLIILFVILIYFTAKGNKNDNTEKNNIVKECSIDSDCDKVCGCHPSSCIPVSRKPVCEMMFCTQDCSGPLDCGAGHCGCMNGKCSVVSNSIK